MNGAERTCRERLARLDVAMMNLGYVAIAVVVSVEQYMAWATKALI